MGTQLPPKDLRFLPPAPSSYGSLGPPPPSIMKELYGIGLGEVVLFFLSYCFLPIPHDKYPFLSIQYLRRPQKPTVFIVSPTIRS